VPDALVVRAVVDEQPQVEADLVRGQADAVRRGHRLEHVVDERAQRVVEGLYRLRRVVQNRVACDPDVVNGHAAELIGVSVRTRRLLKRPRSRSRDVIGPW
jgi:hypothetical protein